MQTDVIQRQLKSFIAKTFPVARKRNIGVDDRLLGEGIVDSLGVLDIVGYLESEFHVSIADDDLAPENFETIARLAALVERKLDESKGADDGAGRRLDVERA
jgi:acyl carrier protein